MIDGNPGPNRGSVRGGRLTREYRTRVCEVCRGIVRKYSGRVGNPWARLVKSRRNRFKLKLRVPVRLTGIARGETRSLFKKSLMKYFL